MQRGFLADLERFGPSAPPGRVSLADARAYCRRLANAHYENFIVGSLLLPRRLLKHFHAVYAWCRWADDLADETTPGAALRLLAWWRAELDSMYAGAPSHPVTIALADTVRRFHLPAQPFLDLLSAFAQDQRVKEYATFDQLLDYCRRSANPVGHLVLWLFNAFDHENSRLADSICSGLQLANFWQDVARDADKGRCYLPREDMERFGYHRDAWQGRRCTPAFIELMKFEVERARRMLDSGRALLERAGPDLQGEVELFIGGGLAILDVIAAQGYDTWSRRPAVGRRTQLKLIGKAVAGALRSAWPRAATRAASRKPRASASLAASHRYCEHLARRQAKNFYFAFLLLPSERRRAMSALYAFMRIADDLVDRGGNLEPWRKTFACALQGRGCAHPALPALLDTLEKFAIPSVWLEDLLAGVASDLAPGRRFAELKDLEHYCDQVAGTVGLCCLRVWGCKNPAVEPLALTAGRAFQITNILRDLPEDFRQGRLYLPLSWLQEAEITEGELLAEPNSPAARRIYQRLGELAERNYAATAPLAELLSASGRAVWLVMSRTYHEVLQQLRQRDYDLSGPPVQVGWRKKASLLAGALPARFKLKRATTCAQSQARKLKPEPCARKASPTIGAVESPVL